MGCYIEEEGERMNCVICRTGSVKPGTTTFTVDKDGHTYVLRDVPARVCQQCGEPYFDAEVTQHVLAQVERASETGVQVAVLTYKAA
jgi:YgiT-type zinc finger domain-containing protein